MKYVLEFLTEGNSSMEPSRAPLAYGEASISIYPSSVQEQVVDIKIRYPITPKALWMRSEINRLPVCDVIRNLPVICNTLIKQAQASRTIWTEAFLKPEC